MDVAEYFMAGFVSGMTFGMGVMSKHLAHLVPFKRKKAQPKEETTTSHGGEG